MTPDSGGASSSSGSGGALSQEVTEEPKGEERGDEEGEEARTSRGVKAPIKVSKQEREEHERTHMPYRGWCRYCVLGRGRKMAHQKEREEQGVPVPRISMDYFFMSEEDKKASKNPIIVMIDEESGDRYARAVGQKGIGKDKEMEWLIKDLSLELKAWGHHGGPGGKRVMKSDGEKAIIAVREALARHHGGRITPEAPAKGEEEQVRERMQGGDMARACKE